MRGHFLPWRIIFLCLIAFVVSGCSVQRPDGALDSSGSNGKKQVEKAAAHQVPALEKEPVKVDYLTLLSRVVSPQIYIYKEKRHLYVVQSNVVVRDYPIILGPDTPAGGQTTGYGRAPEGDFHICRKIHGEEPGKALAIDYRYRRQAQRPLLPGIISPLRFKQILLAAESEKAPLWDAKPGGEVRIQADNGQEKLAQGDIGLYSSDMKELYKIASIGTPVHIRP